MYWLNYKRFIVLVAVFILFYFVLVYNLLQFESLEAASSIKNLSDAIWFSIVTLTTVGYGDVIPVSTGGRIISYIFLFLSLGVYGLLIGQISSIFNTIKEHKKLGMHGTNFSDHVVVIGWSSYGKTVIDQLVQAGRKVAIVTKERDNVDLIHEYYQAKHVFVLFTDYDNYEYLHKVNIEKSSTVFINLEDDTDKLVYILNVKKHFKPLQYVVTLDNANLKSTFISAGVKYAISKHEISSRLMASYMFEPDVAQYSEEIISFPVTDEDHDIKQFKILQGNPYINNEYGKAFYDLKKSCNVILIGLVKMDGEKRMLHKNPEDNLIIQQDDFLIMIMNRKAEAKIRKLFNSKEGI